MLKAKHKAKNVPAEAPAPEKRSIKPNHVVPHVEIPSVNREKQPRPGPTLPLPAPIGKGVSAPQYRYRAPVENEEIPKKVYDKILDLPVVLTIEECMSAMPGVRKYFKDATTGRRVPTEEEKAAGLVEVREEDPVSSSFALTLNSGVVFEAKPSLSLRCVDVLLNDIVKVEAILDTGCQVILVRKDIWVKLRVPLMAQHVLTMESANGTRNSTAGLIPRVKLTLGSINLWCPIQVVENAPFEMLLGRPFMAVGQCITRDTYDGDMEITLTDPDTGEVCTIPTHARSDGSERNVENPEPARAPLPCLKGFH